MDGACVLTDKFYRWPILSQNIGPLTLKIRAFYQPYVFFFLESELCVLNIAADSETAQSCSHL